MNMEVLYSLILSLCCLIQVNGYENLFALLGRVRLHQGFGPTAVVIRVLCSTFRGVHEGSDSRRRVLLHELSSLPPSLRSADVRLCPSCPYVHQNAAEAVGRRVLVCAMRVLAPFEFRFASASRFSVRNDVP